MIRTRPTPVRTLTLANDLLCANWHVNDRRLEGGMLTPQAGHHENVDALPIAPPFILHFADGTCLNGSQMNLRHIRIRRRRIVADFLDHAHALRITWKASLGVHDAFLRQTITLKATKQDVPITRVTLLDAIIPNVTPSGTLPGCPLITPRAFYAFEHPLAEHHLTDIHQAEAFLLRTLPLKASHQCTYSSVIGVAAEGQLRRSFSLYVEAIRPRRTRPMLHYNCWYDLSYSNIRYDEAGIVRTIHALGDALCRKRHIPLDACVLDDGWDNPARLWHLHQGFPRGFRTLSRHLRGYGMQLGIWLSPWGGYGEEKVARLASATSMGMEQNAHGLALSGQKYFSYFLSRCLDLLRRYPIMHFKLDGMGKTDSVQEGSAHNSDFDAAIALIHQLRSKRRNLYINLTVGTYGSPFWLLYADSIWRGGADHGFEGAGSDRQQWITYRDAQTYANIVQQSELFPLPSLMLHGIILAQHCPRLNHATDEDFAAEVQSFFASGTQCQELYLSPHLLTETQWDLLAQGAAFARLHAALLRDTHWIGGNPHTGEIYGWAAWRDHEALITLRNPSDQMQHYKLDVAHALELPTGKPSNYLTTRLFVANSNQESWDLDTSINLQLAPFEVATWYLTMR